MLNEVKNWSLASSEIIEQNYHQIAESDTASSIQDSRVSLRTAHNEVPTKYPAGGLRVLKISPRYGFLFGQVRSPGADLVGTYLSKLNVQPSKSAVIDIQDPFRLPKPLLSLLNSIVITVVLEYLIHPQDGLMVYRSLLKLSERFYVRVSTDELLTGYWTLLRFPYAMAYMRTHENLSLCRELVAVGLTPKTLLNRQIGVTTWLVTK